MATPPFTLPAATSLHEVTEQLLGRKISGVPLTDRDRLVGVVTTTDLLADLVRGKGALGSRPASEIMQSAVFTIAPDASLAEVASILSREHVHRVVVTEGERVVGVVSSSNLLDDVKARVSPTPISSLMMRAIATVDVGARLDDAITALELAHVHGIVVVDGDRPVGVLTHREALLARRLPPDLRAQPVEEVMSYETICLDDDTPIHRAAAYAMAMNVKRLLVVSKRRLVGIVSALDLVATLRERHD